MLGSGGAGGLRPQTGGPPAQGVGGPPQATTPQAPRQGPQVGGPPNTPFSPPKPGAPQLSARLPEGGPSFRPGAVLHGQVAGKQPNGEYTLRLGDQTLQTRSSVPLQVGQSIQLRVQGENQGQLNLQVVKSPFQRQDTTNLSTALTGMNIPASESNVELAKSMVEKGIPLTKENFQKMQAQTVPAEGNKTPPPIPARVTAATFLQQNSLPATPQNVATLSNFLAANPQMGQQMFQLNGELRKFAKSMDSRTLELLKDLPGIAGETGLLGTRKADSKPPPPPSKKLFNMAKQVGIEGNLYPGVGEEENPWDLVAEMRRWRDENKGADDEGTRTLMALMEDIEQNLEAQKLINQAHPELAGYFYLQVPFSGCEDGAEVWVRYDQEEDGNKFVDPDEARLEFLVTTEHMGELFFVLDVKQGTVTVEVGTASRQVRQFVDRYLPVLEDRLQGMGWQTEGMEVVYRPHGGGRQLVEHTDFERIETCDVQA